MKSYIVTWSWTHSVYKCRSFRSTCFFDDLRAIDTFLQTIDETIDTFFGRSTKRSTLFWTIDKTIDTFFGRSTLTTRTTRCWQLSTDRSAKLIGSFWNDRQSQSVGSETIDTTNKSASYETIDSNDCRSVFLIKSVTMCFPIAILQFIFRKNHQ